MWEEKIFPSREKNLATISSVSLTECSRTWLGLWPFPALHFLISIYTVKTSYESEKNKAKYLNSS